MNRSTILFSFVLMATTSFGQLRTADDQPEDFRDQFFFSLSLAPFYDMVTSPVTSATTLEVDPNDPLGPKVERQTTYQSQSFSPLTIGATVRYNLYEFTDDVSLGVAIPFSFGFSTVQPRSDQINGREGFGHVQVPFLAQLSYGLGSTYYSEKDMGIVIAAGTEYNKVGIVGDSRAIDVSNAPWFMWSLQAGIVTWRGGAPIEYGLKYGFGPETTYNKDKDGRTLSTPITTQASSLKFTISYHLNY